MDNFLNPERFLMNDNDLTGSIPDTFADLHNLGESTQYKSARYDKYILKPNSSLKRWSFLPFEYPTGRTYESLTKQAPWRDIVYRPREATKTWYVGNVLQNAVSVFLFVAVWDTIFF